MRITDIPEFARYVDLHASDGRTGEEEEEMYELRCKLHEAGFLTNSLGIPQANSDRTETYYVWFGDETFEYCRTYTASSHWYAADLEADSWYADYGEPLNATLRVLVESDMDDLEEPEEDASHDPRGWDQYYEQLSQKAKEIPIRVQGMPPLVNMNVW